MSQGELTINKFKWKVLKSVYFKFDSHIRSLFENSEYEDIIQNVIDVIIDYYFDIAPTTAAAFIEAVETMGAKQKLHHLRLNPLTSPLQIQCALNILRM
jgi:hypothetical protein